MAASVAKRDTSTVDGTSYRSHACILEAWVCSACSYTELYGMGVSDLEMLALHPDGGVRIHQAATSPAYR